MIAGSTRMMRPPAAGARSVSVKKRRGRWRWCNTSNMTMLSRLSGANGRAWASHTTSSQGPGSVEECVDALLNGYAATGVIASKAYDNNALRRLLLAMGALNADSA